MEYSILSEGEVRIVYCNICGEVHSVDKEVEEWYRGHEKEHRYLFHKEVDTGKIEEKKENTVERLYKCDICNTLYREKSSIEKHLKYLHKIEDKNVEPVGITNTPYNHHKSKGNKFGIVIDKKSRKSIVSLVREGDYVICRHCNNRYNDMFKLAEHIKRFSNTNAEDWVIEGGRDLLSFLS